MTLPPAEWRDREGLHGLVAVLGEGDARIVGGAVRDTLLGLPVADVDIATRHGPDVVIARLKQVGIGVVPTGLAHGTVTALLSSGPVEVTSLRRDVSTDGRHAIIAFSEDWREDAARRDFTVNALYADLASGEVHDWFGGLDDLEAGRVRFIGDPLQRIAEDHLRILRFFRFHARFGPEDQRTIDAEGLAACVLRANDLMALSRERIASELLRLLVAREAIAVVALMVERGILLSVLPEIDAQGVDCLRVLAHREAASGIAPDAIRRLAALLPASASDAVGARLKLSGADRKRLVAANAGPGDEGPRALAYRVGPASAADRLLLAGEPVDAIAGWSPPVLPIGGGTLVARGLRKGPVVAETLRVIETRWIAEGFPDADRVARILDEAMDQLPDAVSTAKASSASSGRA